MFFKNFCSEISSSFTGQSEEFVQNTETGKISDQPISSKQNSHSDQSDQHFADQFMKPEISGNFGQSDQFSESDRFMETDRFKQPAKFVVLGQPEDLDQSKNSDQSQNLDHSQSLDQLQNLDQSQSQNQDQSNDSLYVCHEFVTKVKDCEFQTSDSKFFLDHVTAHHNGTVKGRRILDEKLPNMLLKCAYCKMMFNYISNLTKHLDARHFDKKSFECKKFFKIKGDEKDCEEMFETLDELKNHLKWHETTLRKERIYKCEKCDIQFEKARQLRAHHR